ncbi:CHAT domain protein [Polystyrenella longa]|uniref:CHAT domain protein n=2 Tax=Polystyrenella longa TaxID=2528007 RepID=A0A518CNF1_9PLAN|nr:CHAT domain protein [Polystyrenella longa]
MAKQANSKDENEPQAEEISNFIKAQDWPALLRLSIIPHPLENQAEEGLQEVFRSASVISIWQRIWLCLYISYHSVVSTPTWLLFEKRWTSEQLDTLKVLPNASIIERSLNIDFVRRSAKSHQDRVLKAARFVIIAAERLGDKHLSTFASLVEVTHCGVHGDLPSAVARLIELHEDLLKSSPHTPVINAGTLEVLAGIARPFLSELTDKASIEYERNNNYEEARQLLLLANLGWKTFVDKDLPEDVLQRSRTMQAYAILLSKNGDAEKADAYHVFAVRMLRQLVEDTKGGYQVEYASSLRNYTGFLFDMGQPRLAIHTAEEAIEIVKPLYARDPINYCDLLAGLYNNHAMALIQIDLPGEALSSSASAVRIREKEFETRLKKGSEKLVLAMELYASALNHCHRMTESKDVFESAIATIQDDDRTESHKKHHLLASLYLNYSETLAKLDDSEAARQHAETAWIICRDMFRQGISHSPSLRMKASEIFARRLIPTLSAASTAEQLDIAEAALRMAIEVSEEIRVGTKSPSGLQGLEYSLSDVFDGLIQVLLIRLDRGRSKEDIANEVLKFSEMSRMRSLSSVLANDYCQLEGVVDGKLLAQLRDTQANISAMNNRLFYTDHFLESTDLKIEEMSKVTADFLILEKPELHQQRHQYENDLKAIQKRIEEQIPAFEVLNVFTPLELSEIREMLPDEQTAFLYFHMADRVAVCVVVTHATVELIEYPQTTREETQSILREWAAAYQNSCDSGGKLNSMRWGRLMRPLLDRLGNLLFDSVYPKLPNSIQSLIIVPHRELHSFPFHICPGRQPYKFLCDEFSIHYVPSFSVLSQCLKRSRGPMERMLSVRRTADLEFLEIEEKMLTVAFGTNAKYLDSTPEVVHQLRAASAEIDIFHHSGHGYYDQDDPLNSSLVFWENGNVKVTFSVQDVLETIKFRNATLVVLACCEGGIVQPDEVDEHFGFPTAFLVAGMKVGVFAMWQVDDLATAILVTRFYERLLSGLSPARALDQTQRWMRGVPDDLAECLEDGPATADYVEKMGMFTGISDHSLRADCESVLKHWRDSETPPFQSPVFWAAFFTSGVSQ